MSVILKLPRFFHFKLIYINDVPEYWTTPIIEDPDYIRFSSYWDDLFTTGFLPLAISMFFNLKIYLKVIILINFNFDDTTYIIIGIKTDFVINILKVFLSSR